jgi:hypothetical protein
VFAAIGSSLSGTGERSLPGEGSGTRGIRQKDIRDLGGAMAVFEVG